MSTSVKFKAYTDSSRYPFIAVGRNGLFQATGVTVWPVWSDRVMVANITSKGLGGRHSLVIPLEDAVAVAGAILKEAGKRMPPPKRGRQPRELANLPNAPGASKRGQKPVNKKKGDSK